MLLSPLGLEFGWGEIPQREIDPRDSDGQRRAHTGHKQANRSDARTFCPVEAPVHCGGRPPIGSGGKRLGV
jgi:hypothetical protein